MSVTDEPVNAISLIIYFSSSSRLAFMNHQLVPVGVAKLRHPANGRFRFLYVECHAALFELRVCSIEIFDLECDCCPIARRFPSRMRTNSDRSRAKIVLDPRTTHLCARRL